MVLYYNSANFDEEVFDRPRTFDVGRSPNDHVAFGGGGSHHCLGAFLARLEVTVLLEEIVRRGIAFELAAPPTRVRSSFVAGIEALPARVVRVR